ncbi:DUF6117 family protein [Sphingomonas leidyi]|uniref:DUF6117 family protein n=1 Tax=Sphingomonas leidyi TaxID=68569 RepID=UPI003BADA04F
MAIPDAFRRNFSTLLRAAESGDLALVECTDVQTGASLRDLRRRPEDGDYVITPFGHLHDGNPFEAYRPPESSLH